MEGELGQLMVPRLCASKRAECTSFGEGIPWSSTGSFPGELERLWF